MDAGAEPPWLVRRSGLLSLVYELEQLGVRDLAGALRRLGVLVLQDGERDELRQVSLLLVGQLVRVAAVDVSADRETVLVEEVCL